VIVKRLFAFIFLFGMVFTVVNYLPLLEEECGQKCVEHSKKITDTEGSDSGADGDTEHDSEDNFFSGVKLAFAALPVSSRSFVNITRHCCSFPAELHTPPPRA
jgi:hypothetical protein